MELIALQLKTSKNFEKNLQKLIKHIKKQEDSAFVVAPELFLTGYSYDRMDEAVTFCTKALKTLKFLSYKKTIAITLPTKKNGFYFNTFHLLYKGKVLYTQSKYQLFKLGDEHKFFQAGEKKDIKPTTMGGLKVGTLICFELRFIELWERLKGCDIIVVPAMWGKARKKNYEILCRALAVANQCYVIASDSSNENMAKSSSIISPFGSVIKNDAKKVIKGIFDPKEIKKMRRYLPVGIK
jgi:omega-amidase